MRRRSRPDKSCIKIFVNELLKGLLLGKRQTVDSTN